MHPRSADPARNVVFPGLGIGAGCDHTGTRARQNRNTGGLSVSRQIQLRPPQDGARHCVWQRFHHAHVESYRP
jgi:hypothetical protein